MQFVVKHALKIKGIKESGCEKLKISLTGLVYKLTCMHLSQLQTLLTSNTTAVKQKLTDTVISCLNI